MATASQGSMGQTGERAGDWLWSGPKGFQALNAEGSGASVLLAPHAYTHGLVPALACYVTLVALGGSVYLLRGAQTVSIPG